MTQPEMAANGSPNNHSVLLAELESARSDLGRLSVLVSEAFSEVLASFVAIQAAAHEWGMEGRFEEHTRRAVTALQCEDMTNQLIIFTQKRLAAMEGVLDNLPDPVKESLAATVAKSGLVATGPYGKAASQAPVQQDTMDSGTVDLF